MTINTTEEMLDHVLMMVSETEPDREVAISVAATIGSLMLRGYGDLALQIIDTYKPETEEL